MMKKLLFLWLFFAVLFAACTDDDDNGGEIPMPEVNKVKMIVVNEGLFNTGTADISVVYEDGTTIWKNEILKHNNEVDVETRKSYYIKVSKAGYNIKNNVSSLKEHYIERLGDN